MRFYTHSLHRIAFPDSLKRIVSLSCGEMGSFPRFALAGAPKTPAAQGDLGRTAANAPAFLVSRAHPRPSGSLPLRTRGGAGSPQPKSACAVTRTRLENPAFAPQNGAPPGVPPLQPALRPAANTKPPNHTLRAIRRNAPLRSFPSIGDLLRFATVESVRFAPHGPPAAFALSIHSRSQCAGRRMEAAFAGSRLIDERNQSGQRFADGEARRRAERSCAASRRPTIGGIPIARFAHSRASGASRAADAAPRTREGRNQISGNLLRRYGCVCAYLAGGGSLEPHFRERADFDRFRFWRSGRSLDFMPARSMMEVSSKAAKK